jgi:hypothetical protein
MILSPEFDLRFKSGKKSSFQQTMLLFWSHRRKGIKIAIDALVFAERNMEVKRCHS